MNAQLFAQAGIAFVAGVTAVNILISFVQLCVEERKKCSIIDRSGKRYFAFTEKKKYAVLSPESRTA